MPDIYIDPVQGNDNGTGTAASPYKTWAAVNRLLVAGVTVYAASGQYSGVPVFATSGTAEQPIRIIGASRDDCVLTRNISFNDRKFISLSNLRIHATTTGWFTSNAASENITLDNVRLTCEKVAGAALPYVGGIFNGRYHRFTRSSVEGWLHGDAIELGGDYTLVEDIDAGACDSPHGIFAIRGSHNVVRGSDRSQKMVLRNRWDRAFDTTQFGTRGQAIENLFENLHVVQCNWDGSYPLISPWPSSTPGAIQIIKIGGDGNIYRNIDIELSQIAPASDYPYTAVMQIGNFAGGQGGVYLSEIFRNQRFYMIRYLDNESNAIAVTLNNAIPHDYSNNVWFNCEFRGNKNALFLEGGIPIDCYPTLHHCQIADPISLSNEQRSFADYEARFPALAYANTDGATKPELAPLGRVTVATQGQVIDLDDARAIFDGKGIIAGDVLVIGDNAPVQVTRKVNATRIEVARDIVVVVGDPVWLDYWIVETPAPPPPPPPLEAGTYDISGTITLTRRDEIVDDA